MAIGTVIAIAVLVPFLFYYLVGSEWERERDRQQQEERRRRSDELQRETRRAQRRESIERSRAAVDTSRSPATQNQHLRSLLPPSTNRIPRVELGSYLQNAREQQSQRRVGSRLWRDWQILIDGLKSPRNPATAVHAIHLDIPTLESCYNFYDNSVIRLLISKANSLGLGEIAVVYLQPLMYPRMSAKDANARLGDYSPLASESLTHFYVKMETLSDKIYKVRSFFGAVHAILYYCLPPNRNLQEYIEILTHLTNLLERALRPYLSERTQLFRAKISLLVILSPIDSRDSRAIIGFNAVGDKELKSIIIQERLAHLSELRDVQLSGLTWSAGNCAEDETFAHFHKLCSSPMGQSRELIAASLTLNILDGESNGPCKQCVQLMKILRDQLRTVTILSLAPVRGNRVEQLMVTAENGGQEMAN